MRRHTLSVDDLRMDLSCYAPFGCPSYLSGINFRQAAIEQHILDAYRENTAHAQHVSNPLEMFFATASSSHGSGSNAGGGGGGSGTNLFDSIKAIAKNNGGGGGSAHNSHTSQPVISGCDTDEQATASFLSNLAAQFGDN